MRSSVLYIAADPGPKGRAKLFERMKGLYEVHEGIEAPDALSGAELLKTKQGKPYFPREAQTGVSISHSAGLYGVLFSGTEVGMDLQKKRGEEGHTLADPDRIARRIYHPIDTDWMLFGDVRTRFFFLWTAFEANRKFTGDGIFGGETPIVHPSWEEFPIVPVVSVSRLGSETRETPLPSCRWIRDGLTYQTIWFDMEFVCTCVAETEPLSEVVYL